MRHPMCSPMGSACSCWRRTQIGAAARTWTSLHHVARGCFGWPASGQSIGYLLKSRVTDVADFIDTLQRISNGASVVDPALVQELVTARRRNDPLAALSQREREVLALMAEGRSNAGIGHRLWVTEGTVEKHVRSIMNKLNLPETGEDHRRVLAVIAFLDAN